MQNFFSFTRISHNKKTGPIPVTSSESATCPTACPLKKNGCYAELSFTGIHWRKLDAGQGISWNTLCDNIAKLPAGTTWRHNVMGDLPHDNQLISWTMVYALIDANKGKRGFTYTHHLIEGASVTASENRDTIRRMNQAGFTVNLSANSPEHADTLADLDAGPVVCMVAEDTPKLSHTPAGRTIVVCPAVTTEDMDCARCQLCAKGDRASIIGFPVHGAAKKKAQNVINVYRKASA